VKIYVAGISGEQQYVKSLRSFYEIRLRPGDIKQERAIGRGDVARMLAGEEFNEKEEYDAIALFDVDMLHPPDALEKMRSHDLDMVTGHYYARNLKFVHSIIWELGDGTWPFTPLVDVPKTGLHEVAISGMGCVLIKRDVFNAVSDFLPPGDHPFSIGPCPEVTGDYRTLGTDFRFFAIARLLGYKLWLDADIECQHATVLWLNRDLAGRLNDPKRNFEWLQMIATQIREADGMNDKFLEVRVKQLQARLEDLQTQHAQMNKSADFLRRQIEAVKTVLSEDLFLMEESKKGKIFPTVPEEQRKEMLENRTKLPGNMPDAEAKRAREHMLGEEAKGFVDDLQVIQPSE